MEQTIRRRTLRRRQRTEILTDYRQDMQTVQKLIDSAVTPKELRAYEVLYGILYTAYCEVIDSEV